MILPFSDANSQAEPCSFFAPNPTLTIAFLNSFQGNSPGKVSPTGFPNIAAKVLKIFLLTVNGGTPVVFLAPRTCRVDSVLCCCSWSEQRWRVFIFSCIVVVVHDRSMVRSVRSTNVAKMRLSHPLLGSPIQGLPPYNVYLNIYIFQ